MCPIGILGQTVQLTKHMISNILIHRMCVIDCFNKIKGVKMKYLIITIIFLALNSVFAQNHGDHSKHVKKDTKQINSNKKIKTTEDLKIRMEKIISLMKELKDKKNDSKEVAKYSKSITETVNDIFKNCKLEPAADMAIHPLLGLILEGTTEIEKGKYDAGNAKIHEALLGYDKQFIHEGRKQ